MQFNIKRLTDLRKKSLDNIVDKEAFPAIMWIKKVFHLQTLSRYLEIYASFKFVVWERVKGFSLMLRLICNIHVNELFLQVKFCQWNFFMKKRMRCYLQPKSLQALLCLARIPTVKHKLSTSYLGGQFSPVLTAQMTKKDIEWYALGMEKICALI